MTIWYSIPWVPSTKYQWKYIGGVEVRLHIYSVLGNRWVSSSGYLYRRDGSSTLRIGGTLTTVAFLYFVAKKILPFSCRRSTLIVPIYCNYERRNFIIIFVHVLQTFWHLLLYIVAPSCTPAQKSLEASTCCRTCPSCSVSRPSSTPLADQRDGKRCLGYKWVVEVPSLLLQEH
jgi:hypothetical protein